MSKTISRRQFSLGALAGLSAAATLSPFTVLGQSKPKLVVIGGGAGGGTVARYVSQTGLVDVTLVEINKTYTTCFFSNLYLGGFRSFDSITHSYDKLASDFGVKVVNARAQSIDTDGRTVSLDNGEKLPYDRLVVAPGIDFKMDAIEGYDDAAAEIMPHAYKAGPQPMSTPPMR